jgi:hypothetical protein
MELLFDESHTAFVQVGSSTKGTANTKYTKTQAISRSRVDASTKLQGKIGVQPKHQNRLSRIQQKTLDRATGPHPAKNSQFITHQNTVLSTPSSGSAASFSTINVVAEFINSVSEHNSSIDHSTPVDSKMICSEMTLSPAGPEYSRTDLQKVIFTKVSDIDRLDGKHATAESEPTGTLFSCSNPVTAPIDLVHSIENLSTPVAGRIEDSVEGELDRTHTLVFETSAHKNSNDSQNLDSFTFAQSSSVQSGSQLNSSGICLPFRNNSPTHGGLISSDLQLEIDFALGMETAEANEEIMSSIGRSHELGGVGVKASKPECRPLSISRSIVTKRAGTMRARGGGRRGVNASGNPKDAGAYASSSSRVGTVRTRDKSRSKVGANSERAGMQTIIDGSFRAAAAVTGSGQKLPVAMRTTGKAVLDQQGVRNGRWTKVSSFNFICAACYV